MNNINSYRDLYNELNLGKKGVMVSVLGSKKGEKKDYINKIFLSEENFSNLNCIENLNDIICEKSLIALKSGNLQYIKDSGSENYLIEPYYPEPSMIVFGAGHIAKSLTEFASKLGFSVTVIDDRASFANKERFPNAEKVICESFEKAFKLISLNTSTFIVIVTRGHHHDMDCLKQALKYKTAYVGMIGSKHKVRCFKDQLLGEGYSKEQLDMVNAPIGVDIGAVTPEEIAVSIIAQVISYRRRHSLIKENSCDIKVNWPELDRAVLEELCKDNTETKAVITVVSTKGSVPRKAGAKMLVWPDGRILGSIGGGFSEGEAIIAAHDVIRSGGYQDKVIDMTGQIAEDEGMVCGGIMQIVIEAYS